MPIEATVTELHVAEALLQLHGGPRDPPVISDVPRLSPDNKMEIESAATLLLSCFTTPDRYSDNKRHIKEQRKLAEREDHRVKNVLSLCMRTIREMKSDSMYTGLISNQQMSPASGRGNSLPQVVVDTDTSSDSDSDPGSHGSGRRHRKRNATPHFNNRDASSSSRIPSSRHQTPHQRSRSMICSTPVSATNGTQNPPLTFDQGTQTDMPEFYKKKLEEMEEVIKRLYSRFLNLVSLNMQNENAYVSFSGTDQDDLSESERNGVRSSPEQSGHHSDSNLNGHSNGEFGSNAKTLQVRRVSAHTTNTAEPSFANEDDMVPIGAGNAVVPRRLLNDIDWTSYSTSTRQLLQAVFPRRVLATHSLTGKQSPAFANKPPKKRLDPLIVNDIVDTVSERCGVSKRLVRSSITIKCTDESKLYRNRQQHKHARLESHNQENVPPLPSSDDSSTITE